MKQKNKIIIASAIIALIIIVGIVIVGIYGFIKELRFENSQRIDIYTEQKVDKQRIKDIANEVLGMHNMVQTVEIYQDMVTIRAYTISEEQKNVIVNKVKEIYEFEQTAEKTDINNVKAVRIRDMYKQYVLPITISALAVLVYMMIRYHKKGILKVALRTIIIPIVVELVILSWMAIVRIPIGRITPVIIILAYIFSIIFVINENEK